jgi:hypothetical protein
VTTSVRQGPLEHAPAASSQPGGGARDRRLRRRRKRIWFEEMLGWVLVPLILLASYWAADTALTALGIDPAALIGYLASLVRGR